MNINQEENSQILLEGYISKPENSEYDYSNVPEITFNSTATFRSSLYSHALETLSKGATNPTLLKFTGGVLIDSPFSAIGIALSMEKEGVLQATITGIMSNTATTAIAVTLIGPAVAGLGLSSAGIIVTSAIVTGITGYIIDNLADYSYDIIEKKINEIKYNEITKELNVITTLSDLDDINTLIYPTASYLPQNDDFIKNILVTQNTEEGTNTYTIKSGDNIWDICQKYDIDMQQLIEANPWLEERFSENRDFALIKPGESLTIPPKDSNEFGSFVPDSDNPAFADQFNSASTTEPIIRDPLIIDLNGDGINTTSLNDGTYFDHDKNGFAEKSAWVDVNDGILVFDKNNNGIIDNGNEIFGDSYVKADGTTASNGFNALASLDSNGDNVIDINDSEFNNIKILKGDGALISLADAGIASINLSHSSTNITDENGNTQLHIGSYTKVDGTTGDIGDYNFVRDTLHTQSIEIVEINDTIAGLPDAKGFGNVDSLQQAMAKDSSVELQALVQSFVNEVDGTKKYELAKRIVLKWTGADSVEVSSRGEFINAQELAALEKFMGKNYVGIPEQGSSTTTSPNSQAANLLNAAYSSLTEYVYAQLVSQTSMSNIYDMISLKVDIETGEGKFDLTAVTNYIKQQILMNKSEGDSLLAEFNRTFVNMGLKEYSNYEIFYNEFIEIDSSYSLIFSISEKTVINGSSENDSINGGASNEAIFGFDGNDTIYSRQGDDIVYGGDGDDYIDSCENNDLVYGGNGIDTILGGAGDDTLYGDDGDDSIDGGNGDDLLYGGNGNDIIHSGTQDKTTIIGGAGDDTLYSASENYKFNETTYIYNSGDGNDTIYVSVNQDILSLGEGITKENIRFSANGLDLLITFTNESGSILIKNAYEHNYNLDLLKFADGSTYDMNQINALLETHGTNGDDSIDGTSKAEKIFGLDGNDTIYGKGGNDTIYGGNGDDSIIGGNGESLIYGHEGNDYIISATSGNATIVGGTGNDYIENNTKYRNDSVEYVYNVGDGNDTIYGYVTDDIISFGEGISKDNIMFSAIGKDLHITFKNQEGSIVVKDNYGNNHQLDLIKFADGSTYDLNQINALLATYGTNGDDSIEGTSKAEKIFGLDGNDTIYANGGNDTIYGGNGDDSIIGGSGDNLIFGGDGNDYIQAGGSGNVTVNGGKGDDILTGLSQNYRDISTTYVYNLGDGNDIIRHDYGANYLELGEDFQADDIALYLDKANCQLKIGFSNSDDVISVQYKDHKPYMDEIRLSDGSYINNDIINRLIQDINNYAASNDIELTSIESVKNNQDLMNLVAGSWQN